MKTLTALIQRNTRLFFKDKGMFFTSLITPAILLLLYSTFLGKVYKDSFSLMAPAGFSFPGKLTGGFVAGEILSSILAVSCVTVAFCSNMLMVQDRSSQTINDLLISPVKRSVLAVSYYISSLISTLIICFTAACLCLFYVYIKGWYMSFSDVIAVFADSFLLVMFGTALSSIINFFLTTQGQMQAAGTIVSSGYGFICGAYMPVSGFSEGLQKIISFLPGTYGTSLLRNHALAGTFREMKKLNLPDEVITSIKENTDCIPLFYDHSVNTCEMYVILGATIIILVILYVFMNILKKQ